MKLPDVNLLIYAYDTHAHRHALARAWFEGIMSGAETVAFAWVVLLGFVRLTTQASILTSPLTVDESFDYVQSWLSQPNATVVHPAERHASILRELLVPVGSAGNLTNDAHLAALAIENGAELCSADNDFARYPGLRWTDPLRV